MADGFSLRSQDIINSNLGDLWVTFPSGIRRRMGEVRNIQARLEVAVEEFRCLGEMMHRHKGVGTRGSGSMTLYTGTPEFLSLLRHFNDDHINYRVSITCQIYDPETAGSDGRGSQMAIINDVLLHGVELFKLDTEDGILDQDVDFDFDSFTIPQPFNGARPVET